MEKKEEKEETIEEEIIEEENFEEVKIAKKEMRTDSYFDGKLIELIGYRILGYIITAFTLTIASAWAEKLIIAYKIDHTVYNGKRLKFEGTGASLFVQRFKWIFFTIITLGIYSLWIPIKKEKWIVSNIRFADEDFIPGESYFDGKLFGMIGVNLFCRVITILSLGLLYPFGLCYKQKWIAKHTIINRKRIVFDGKAVSLIGHYILWWFLSGITVGIFALWVPIKLLNWEAKNTHIKTKDEEYEKDNQVPAIIGIVLAIVVAIGLVLIIPKTNIVGVIAGDKSIKEAFDDFIKSRQGLVVEKGTAEGSMKYIYNDSITVTFDGSNNEYYEYKALKYGSTLGTIEAPTREGYVFVRWEDGNGVEVTPDYVVTGPITLIAIWEPVVTTTTKTYTAPVTERCNPGYVYVADYNACYSKDDYVDAVTINIGEGENMASGIHCPDGYEMSWEVSPEGLCHRKQQPNY